MNVAMSKVERFHTIFGLPVRDEPIVIEGEERKLRKDLLVEEFYEYLAAESKNDLVEMADAMADMVYVICGTALAYGIPLATIFDEVHSSNMSKLDEQGQPIFREDGKILKGPNFFKPRIKELMEAK